MIKIASHTFEIIKEDGNMIVLLNGEVNSKISLSDPELPMFKANRKAEIKYLKDTQHVKVLGTCFLR